MAEAQSTGTSQPLTIRRSGEDNAVIACYLAAATRRVEGDALVGTLHIQNLSGTWIYVEVDPSSSVFLPEWVYLLGPGADKQFENFAMPVGSSLRLNVTTSTGLWGVPVSDPKLWALRYSLLIDLIMRGFFSHELHWDFFNEGLLGVAGHIPEMILPFLAEIDETGTSDLWIAITSHDFPGAILAMAQMAVNDEAFLDALIYKLGGRITRDALQEAVDELAELASLPARLDLITSLHDATIRAAGSAWTRLEVVKGNSEPEIFSILPSKLRTAPNGERQMIVLQGTGFTSLSRLFFFDGTNAYIDRVPIYVSPTELRYEVAVGTEAATWQVRVHNGTLVSAPRTFEVVEARAELQSLTITGPGSLPEGTAAQFSAMATFADGSVAAVPAVWSVSGLPGAQVSGGGFLSVGAVNGDAIATLAAGYELGGVVRLATASVVVRHAQAPPAGAGTIFIDGPGIMSAGSTGTFTLREAQPDGSALVINSTRWDSSNSGLLSLAADGRGTATSVMVQPTPVTVFAYRGVPGNETRYEKTVSVMPAAGSVYHVITVVEASTGTVTFDPEPEISDGRLVFRAGQTVTAIAVPSGGYSLLNWGESALTENPYVFTVTGDRHLRPNFVPTATITAPKTLIVEKPAGLGRIAISSPSVGRLLEKADARFEHTAFAPQERVNSTLTLDPTEEFLGWMPNNSQGPAARTSMVDHYQRVARIRSRLASSTEEERSRRVELKLGGGFVEDGYQASFENDRYIIDNGMFLRMVFAPAPRPGLSDSYADAYLKIPDYVLQTMPRQVRSAQLRFHTTNQRGAVKLMLPDRDISIPSGSTTSWTRVPGAIDFGSPVHEYFAIDSQLAYDITGIFNEWRAGARENFGLILRATTNYQPELASSNDPYFQRRPVLVLEWVEEAAAPAPPIVVQASEGEPVLPRGGAVRLGVSVASDGPVSYQWQRDGQLLPGANGPELFVTEESETGAGRYSLILTNPQGSTTREFVVHPAVPSPPRVYETDDSRSVLLGATATFSARVDGQAPLYLQWFKDGVAVVNGDRIAGATTAHLEVREVGPADAGSYHLRVTNQFGSANGAPIDLTVSTVPLTPVFAVQPESLWVEAGKSARLSARALGVPAPTYQWYRNGRPIVGATGPELTVSSGGRPDAGWYFVEAMNAAGRVRSAPAFLSVSYPGAQVVVAGLARNSENTVPGDLRDVAQLAAGNWHNLALRHDGTVFAWGMNDFGQCDVPPGLADVVAVACGGDFSLALRKDGTLVAWGDNTDGQCIVPVGMGVIVSMAAGNSHALAVNSEGRVFAWGSNSSGQIQLPEGLTNVVAVACGGAHSVALTAEGGIVSWGSNGNGQGDLPAGLGLVEAIATGPGSAHTLALLRDGSLVSWGFDGHGVTQCPPGNDFVAISSTYNNLNALDADGVVTSWGHSQYGQWISGTAPAVALASGSYRNLALTYTPVPRAPRVVEPPQDTMVKAGQSLVLAVRAEGWPAPSYQWRKDGQDIAGANGPSFSIAEADRDSAGVYDVELLNTGGRVLSAPARIRVERQMPSLVWAAPEPVRYGTALGSTHLQATADRDGTLQYDLQAGVVLSAGTYLLTASFQPEDSARVAPAQISTLLVVEQAEQSIEFPGLAPVSDLSSTIALGASASSGLPVSYEVVAGPAIMEGDRLRATGPGTVVVRARQSGDGNHLAAAPVDRELVVRHTFTVWSQSRFSTDELNDAALAGVAADADRDGWTNLAEYALGLDPHRAEGHAVATAARSDEEWHFTYARPADCSDVTYQVEVSSDLTQWTTIGVAHERIATGEVETWRARYPTTSAPNLFFRLRVIRP